MLSSCLLSGLGISIISTGVYIAFANEKGEMDRKIEYGTIFTIIMLVSILVLYITSGKKDQLVPVNMSSGTIIDSKSPTVNNKPPF
tara:strand:+ start:219 stop:476 length:258 start_codon:yes stop_codon:yes gene_type:complete